MVNIQHDLPTDLPEELIEELVRTSTTRIERIVSTGHQSPDNFWYDQTENEWVIVLEGSARLAFDDPPREVVLDRGDYVTIPAHTRHRVSWTDPDRPTLWLAVFY